MEGTKNDTIDSTKIMRKGEAEAHLNLAFFLKLFVDWLPIMDVMKKRKNEGAFDVSEIAGRTKWLGIVARDHGLIGHQTTGCGLGKHTTFNN